MSKPLRSRRWIALLAAYVVALQALLLPLTVVAFAAPDTGLCLSAAGEGSHQPAGSDHGCACAAGCGMQCCAPALGGPSAQAGLAVPQPRSAVVALRAPDVEAGRHTARGPHSPRAPPFA